MRFGMDDLIVIVRGDITDQEKLQERQIDAIVNAAKSTLMGSNQGVDGAIHSCIENLNKKICEELNTDFKEKTVRCPVGKAVLTSGHNLCKYIIHTVGPRFDGDGGLLNECSSSRINLLESCYLEIFKIVRNYPDIRNIAIPVISSGDYGFPFKLAVEVAIAGICNAIIEWQNKDPESFKLSSLDTIYLYIFHETPEKRENHFHCAQMALQRYKKILKKNRRIVFQSSLRAHLRYLKEIREYDEYRGYFFCAKGIRQALMIIRLFFFPWMCLKDLFGGRDWEKRRQFTEIFTISKMIFPVFILWYNLWNTGFWLVPCLIIYNMCDTITYLLVLILMSDIQRPSANIIRSIIMLFINYIEVSLDLAVLYIWYYNGRISVREAVAFGILGDQINSTLYLSGEYIFLFISKGIRFFFISLVFGYLANHMRLRKFKS